MRNVDVLKMVREIILRYNMLERGNRVAVAVSGGADSLCLFLSLRALAGELGIVLSVAHFNHKLRGEASEGDRAFVEEIAKRAGVSYYVADEDVTLRKGNLEQEARRARREFLTGLIHKGVADRVALGHTLDDQAETVLFRVLRGTAGTGLAGIHPVNREGFIRPLLNVRRVDVEEFLNKRQAVWREDTSNQERRFARNRIRHELLPHLEQQWNPGLRESLAHLADVAFEEERYWAAKTAKLARRWFHTPAPGEVEVPIEALRNFARGVQRRLLRRAIEQAKGDLLGLDFDHVDAALELVLRRQGEGRIHLPGLQIERSFGWLRFGPLKMQAPEVVHLTMCGSYHAPDGSLLRLEVLKQEPSQIGEMGNGATLKAAGVDLRLINRELELRGWRRGDRYRPVGHAGDVKIRDLFQMFKVPSWRRFRWPIVTDGSRIIWAKQFGVAAEVAATENAGQVLRISHIEPSGSAENGNPIKAALVESFGRGNSS